MFAFFLDMAGAGEHVLRQLLWFIAIFGSFTSTVFLAMVIVATFRYVAERAQPGRQVLAVPRRNPAASHRSQACAWP